jgi:predicted Zn-dependent peptidase
LATKSGENSAAAIASDVRGAFFYGKNHPSGEIVTEETVKNVTLQDVIGFYNDRFKPSNEGYSGIITAPDSQSFK